MAGRLVQYSMQWGQIRIKDSYIDIIASPLLLPQVIDLFRCKINWLEDNPSSIFEWQVAKLNEQSYKFKMEEWEETYGTLVIKEYKQQWLRENLMQRIMKLL